MKANEAPEKLYLHPTAKGNVGASWLIFPITNEDIGEYLDEGYNEATRKAIKWLENNLQGVIGGNIYIDDFRKYMGGE